MQQTAGTACMQQTAGTACMQQTAGTEHCADPLVAWMNAGHHWPAGRPADPQSSHVGEAGARRQVRCTGAQPVKQQVQRAAIVANIL